MFDYQVAFQVCGWLVCGVRNIQPQLSPQQHASRTVQAQAPLCQLIATCGDCQPHFTVIYQRVANLPFKEKGKVDLKHSAQRRHLSAYVVSLWNNGRPCHRAGTLGLEGDRVTREDQALLLNERTFSCLWEKAHVATSGRRCSSRSPVLRGTKN